MRSDSNAPAPLGPDLEELMGRYQIGDTTAVTALVECLTPQLYRFFASLTNSNADAEDMLQEAWLHISPCSAYLSRGRARAPVAVCDRSVGAGGRSSKAALARMARGGSWYLPGFFRTGR